MVIGFLPPSNWKGANLVTHELHIRKKKKPTLEMKLHLPPEHLISLFQQGGQIGALLLGAEPCHPGNIAGVTIPPASPPSGPVIQKAGKDGHQPCLGTQTQSRAIRKKSWHVNGFAKDIVITKLALDPPTVR